MSGLTSAHSRPPLPQPTGRMVVVEAGIAHDGMALLIPGVSEALRGHAAQGVVKGVLSTSDRIYITKPMIRNGQLLGILRISITLEQFQKQFASVTWTILAALVLACVNGILTIPELMGQAHLPTLGGVGLLCTE